MRLTRWITVALAAVLALSVAGIAVAHKSELKAASTEAAQATFTATANADKTRTRQCTGTDGTYDITHGVYTGTVTGDARLTGNLTIRTKSVVNRDNGLGWTQGRVVVTDAATGKLKAGADLTAVNTERGKLDGLLQGKVKTPAETTTAPKAKRGRHRHGNATGLLANFSAAFNAGGTELSGELGSDAPVAPTNSAIFFGEPCKPAAQTTAQSGDDTKDGKGQRGGRGGRDDR
jgi:hypothetical protein